MVVLSQPENSFYGQNKLNFLLAKLYLAMAKLQDTQVLPILIVASALSQRVQLDFGIHEMIKQKT